MSLIGTCSDCGTGGVSLRYKPEVPINEQSRPSICDRCRDFREEQATHYVPCEECGDRLPSERAHSLDVTAEDEYYPEFIHFCPSCRPEANDDDADLMADGGQPAEDGQGTKQTKYEIGDDHWSEPEDDQTEWQERTSADVEVEVTLHNEGYQTDRRWTVHVHEGHRDHPVAVWAGEHQNKGNYWRDPGLWRDAVDFVELPLAVRKRVASMLNRSVDELTPDERMIHREDGTGLGDRAGDDAGTCDVCGGKVYNQPSDGDPIRHKDCVRGDGRD